MGGLGFWSLVFGELGNEMIFFVGFVRVWGDQFVWRWVWKGVRVFRVYRGDCVLLG